MTTLEELDSEFKVVFEGARDILIGEYDRNETAAEMRSRMER